MDANPVKSMRRLSTPADPEASVTAMTLEQVHDMWVALRSFAESKATGGKRLGSRVVVWADLADLSEAMLCTGVRIGEVLALRGEDVVRDDDGQTVVVVAGHIVRVTGEGIRREPWRKGRRAGVELGVPPW
jgi:integrase